VQHYVPPAQGSIVQNWSPDHPGLDFACLRGSPIVAAHSGELTHGRNSRMGVYAYVTRGNTRTYYAHLQSVQPTGWYEQGEQIGTCGSTGSWSTGPHLHFESNVPYRF
jgi:murein DD-endopeptidase MepM/ murein hydrolase activator NlpD